VIGWESFIVLADVRGLEPDHAQALTLRTAHAVLDSALQDAGTGHADSMVPKRPRAR
jgi:hypothetical protein